MDKLKSNWLLITLGGLALIFIIIHHERNDDHLTPVVQPVTEDTGDITPHSPIEDDGTVVVDVKGEVKQPGVYEIDSSLRVNDVITLAGGFTSEANQFVVNLAQKVHDEMTIIIPSLEEDSPESYPLTTSQKVNLNMATQEELETLNGIGPSKAEAIINYREEYGHFQSIEDLLNVSGIGEKTLDNIRDDIQVP